MKRGLIIATMLIGVAIILKWLSPETISRDLANRLFGMAVGGVLLVFANDVPKALGKPLERMRCDPAEEQAARRFVGWAVTLGGLAYVMVWLLAPINLTKVLAGSLLGAAVLASVVRVAIARGARA